MFRMIYYIYEVGRQQIQDFEYETLMIVLLVLEEYIYDGILTIIILCLRILYMMLN